jgi:flagellar motility protein MotE (MotC chaperone)
MKKVHLILLAAAGLLSFSASFGVSWFSKQKAAAAAALPPAPAASNGSSAAAQPNGLFSSSAAGMMGTDNDAAPSGLSERQLQRLIYDIREKMKEYADREKGLDEEAKRIEVARQSLQGDFEQLTALREKLDLTLVSLKEKEESIRKGVIEIEALERTNLQRLAGTYEKMDATQAGKIMLSMAANNQLQDAVKILYYMNDRNAGKLLGEIGSTQPDIAGVLSLQLKRVKEGG